MKEIEKEKIQDNQKNIPEKSENLTKIKIIFYLLILAGFIIILILSVIVMNPLILIIAFGVALIILYFEINLEKENLADSLNTETKKINE